MKITEQTTLAELEAHLSTLGSPFLTLLKTQQHGQNYHAIAYVLDAEDAGAFNGGGNTIAEAIADALGSLRMAMGVTNLAPVQIRSDHEPLNYVRERDIEASDRESEADIYDRATGDLGRPVDVERIKRNVIQAADEQRRRNAAKLCYGCRHTRAEHPNDTGCQYWHEGP